MKLFKDFNDNNDIDDEDFRKKIEEIRKKGNNKPPVNNFILFIIIAVIMFGLYQIYNLKQSSGNDVSQVTYTNFINKIKTGDIKKLIEKDDKIVGESSSVTYITKKITSRIGDDTNIMNLINSNQNIELISEEGSKSRFITPFILNIVSYIVIITIFVFISRKMLGGGTGSGGIFSITKTNSKLKEKPDVTFENVAGLEEEKVELREIVEFLKDPKKFLDAGARVPKGVLLLGEPGTGKTLLAKAVAGESGATFFSISGSDFVEMYVGVGASRVRDLFEEAKKSKPSIIFIDEIDAIGKKRGDGRLGGNDERDNTLNQLLVEMDGFTTDAQIIVIGATNRDDILDPALLRSGRFDRRIAVEKPDLKSRVEILKIHAKNKTLDKDVKLEDIAKITSGFVGADLENLLNEAAILAVRENRNNIMMKDLDEAVDKIGMGLGQKSKLLSQEDRKMLAYHEGGHALVASLLTNTDKVHKVTIIPRGNAGGYTMTLPDEKLNMRSKGILENIMVAFGGRIGEYLGMDDIGTGAYSDIQSATHYARLFVQAYGLDKEMGPINYEQRRSEEYSFVPSNSDEIMKKLDQRVEILLKEQYDKTLKLLTENKDKLDMVANLLLEKETITGSQVRAIASGLSYEEVLNMTGEELEKYY